MTMRQTPAEPSPADASDTPPPPILTSRRTVLAGAAGTAAVTALAVGLPSASAAPASHRSGDGRPTRPDDDGSPAGAALVAHVRAGSVDEVVVSSGDREVVLTDRALVRALVRALAEGGR